MESCLKFLKIMVAILMSFIATNASAQFSDFVPSIKTSPTKIKSLIVEQTYLYRILEVQPAFRMPIDQYPEKKESELNPEHVLQEQFASMKKGDYARFMKTWTVNSQKEIDARNLLSKLDRNFWIGKWRESLAGKAIDVKNFITYSRFVLIQYALVDTSSAAAVGSDTVAFVKENGRWKMTQELAYEPILSSWNDATGRIRVPPASMIPPSNDASGVRR